MKTVIYLLFLCTFFENSFADTSDIINTASEVLATQLYDERLSTGDSVQISGANFHEQTSTQEYIFSRVLSEALASSLARKGAKISFQEQGQKPLRLLGIYTLNRANVDITIRLRRMGKTASTDIAVAHTSIPMKELNPDWFKLDLSILSNGLVKQLEKNYLDTHEPVVIVEKPVPGKQGLAPLRIGLEFQKFLEKSVKESDIFVGAAFGVNKTKFVLQSNYAKSGDAVRFFLILRDSTGKIVADAAGEIPIKDLSADLLEIVDDSNTEFCVEYSKMGRLTAKADSAAAKSLVDSIASTLTHYGVAVIPCDNLQDDGIRILSSIQIKRKSTRDGFTVNTGTVTLTVLGREGKVLAVLNKSEKVGTASYGDTGVHKVLEKIFASSFQDRLATAVLSP